jgi:hypothetical protein
MSKSLVQLARSESTTAKRGPLIKYILRMELYWLGATLLLWSGSHPVRDWQFSTACWFYLTSSLLVPVIGYASFWLRSDDGHADYADDDKLQHSFTITLTQAGLLILELFMVLMGVVTVERLLF